ncbi:hypothetical protein Bca52824_039787 [Brassica carinata]|uniref:Uncharacterized protein n=1 Tax=Brassica carinata TaxID=52824 RepID=A0A8X7RTN3_BRACI|nr:hypothetical protein Bca52824_039787 [Brassica carinata]
MKITKVFNRNNDEQVGVFGGSHSKKEDDMANEDLSIVRIYIKSRDSRSRVEDSRLSLTRRSDHLLKLNR